jgi:hypothetical protein
VCASKHKAETFPLRPTDPVKTKDFYLLSGRNRWQVERHIAAGDLIYWNQPATRRGVIGQRGYLAYDAVLAALTDRIAGEPQPISRRGIKLALPAMQLVLGRAVDHEDGLLGIGLGADGRSLSVIAGADEDDLAKMMALMSHKAGARRLTFFTPEACVARFLWRTWPAAEIVRERAEKHDIELPYMFALPPDMRPVAVGKSDDWQSDLGGVAVRWSDQAGPSMTRLGLGS